MKERNLLIYKLILLFQLLVYILAFIFCIWTNIIMKLLFYLSFVVISFSSIYSLIFIHISFDIKINYRQNNKLFKYSYDLFCKLNCILQLFLICSIILYYFNNIYYEKYLKNCPFTLSSDIFSNNTSYYEKRRCELYNIYANSRFKYQYICSYNASKDFENDKSDNGLDKIICIPKINNTINNNIINQFSALYDNNTSEFFYCNRFDKPIKNAYIKDEFCNKKNFSKLFDILFLIIQGIPIFFDKLYIRLQLELMKKILSEFLNQAQRLIGDSDDCSTDNDESNSNNISFDEENEENIIVENNEVLNIDLNIKDYYENIKRSKLD